MAEYFNVTTNLGDAEIANAIATNTKIDITHIAFGDGNGSVPTPTKSRTALVREVHRQAVTKYERHATNTNWIVIETIIPSDIGGFTIREIGIIANGKLISHGSHAPFEKVEDPSGVSEYRLKFTQNITDGNVVSITLDESLIFATQAWVEENFIKRSEIVDNLTTDDPSKPVSAKQAKKLQDNKLDKEENAVSASKLNNKVKLNGVDFDGSTDVSVPALVIPIPKNANLNDYKTAGFYSCYSTETANTVTNKPFDFAFSLLVEEASSTKQTLTQYNTGNTAIRVFNSDSNTWTNWKYLAFKTDNITGTAANITGVAAISNGGTGAANASAARSNLGLGSAATRDVGTSGGQLMQVGAFGLGDTWGYTDLQDSVVLKYNHFFRRANGVNIPGGFYGYGCGLNFNYDNWFGQLYFPALSNVSPYFRCGQSLNAPGNFYQFRTTQNTTVNSNGVLVPSSPVIQIHSDNFILNNDAKTLKAECVKVGIGHYEISNVDGFHQDGWYINTPTDRNQNPLVAVEYSFDSALRKITVQSYAVKLGVFPFEPDLTSPMDAPEGRWIDVRLYEPEWLINTELPAVSEIIKDKNGNTAPSVYHYLEEDEWIISEDNAVILAQEKRSLLPKLSKRQFALYMYDHQMYDQVMQAIEANPRFKIEYDAVSDIERLSPTVSEMTALLGWTEDQVDQMWTEALNL